MAAGDQKGPPRRLVEGGDWAARLLKDVPASPKPTSGARERVWAAVRADRSGPKLRLLWTLAPVATCALVFFLVWRPDAPVPAPVASPGFGSVTLTLASGEVHAGEARVTAGASLASGSRVRTGAGSQAHLRFFDASGLLMREGTQVALAQRPEGSVVVLAEGAVVASVSPQPAGRTFAVVAKNVRIDVEGTLFAVESTAEAVTVRVADGVVLVQRVGSSDRVAAGQCWSSRANAVEPCEAPADAATARALTRRSAAEGRVVIEGESSLEVLSDGILLGHPPIQWWTEARSHSFTAQARGGHVDGAIDVEAQREVRLALALPAESGALAARPLDSPVAKPANAPIAHAPKSVAVEPESRVAAPPTPSPAAPPPDSEALYQEAMRLERGGQFEAASKAFESLSARSDRFAELALYELGRVRQRSLKDSAGALAAFDSYRQRFAKGTVRQEVDFSAVDAALSSGDSKRALAEAGAFLDAYPKSEREKTVRRIRADLYREAGDCASAERDYLRLMDEDGAGVDADDCAYYAALCEARQGHPARARERLEGYLQRFPNGKHRAEAMKALENPGK